MVRGLGGLPGIVVLIVLPSALHVMSLRRVSWLTVTAAAGSNSGQDLNLRPSGYEPAR